jgi:transcriptional regulator with XRE-family HTH domain
MTDEATADVYLTMSAWVWADPAAVAALRTGDLGTILRAWRHAHATTQEHLATLLGYDRTYISMIESGRREIHDVPTRRHIAAALAIPPHVLGITDPTDDDHTMMIILAESTIRLADLARAGGRAAEAVNELWPLVVRLEARADEGRLEADTLAVLSRARTSLGVCLGTVLPEEQLHIAAAWTGKGVTAAGHLDDPMTLAHALTMYGNELRKHGRYSQALGAFEQALVLTGSRPQSGPALILLARAAAEAGDTVRFTKSLRAVDELTDSHGVTGTLMDPYVRHEVSLRGLLDLGDLHTAASLAEQAPASPAPVPQWETIATITRAALILSTGDHTTASRLLLEAIAQATVRHLPHQLQRILRLTTAYGCLDLTETARASLKHLRAQPVLHATAES